MQNRIGLAARLVLFTLVPGIASAAAPQADDGKPAKGSAATKDGSDFDPASLVAEPLPMDARLGIAMRLAAAGELAEAASCCDEIGKSLPEGDSLRTRVDRESRRLRELVQWRLDFVEQWKSGTKKLRIEHDGTSTTGTLKGVEPGDVVLLDTKGRELRVALAALDCEQVLRRSTEAKLEVGTPGARAYAALVAGRKNWSKGLAGATPEETELKDDGATWPALLDLGDAAARLQKLAHTSVPVNGVQAAAALADLRVLLAVEAVPKDARVLVAPRLERLRRFAAICFRREFDATGIAGTGILKGRVLARPDGGIRVTYEFDDPLEAQDWTSHPDVIAKRQGGPESHVKAQPEQSWMKIESGNARGFGVAGWVSKLEFAAPMSVEYRYRTRTPDPKHPSAEALTIRVSLCDDLQMSRVESIDFFGLLGFDSASRYFEQSSDLAAYIWDTVFDSRIAHDGKSVTLTVAGKEPRTIPCGPRTSGFVGLWAYSDAIVEFDHVEIEGHVVERSLEPLRLDWIDRQVAALEKGDDKASKNAKRTK